MLVCGILFGPLGGKPILRLPFLWWVGGTVSVKKLWIIVSFAAVVGSIAVCFSLAAAFNAGRRASDQKVAEMATRIATLERNLETANLQTRLEAQETRRAEGDVQDLEEVVSAILVAASKNNLEACGRLPGISCWFEDDKASIVVGYQHGGFEKTADFYWNDANGDDLTRDGLPQFQLEVILRGDPVTTK